MVVISGSPAREVFEEDVVIHLNNRGVVDSCLFKGDVTIEVPLIGCVEHNLFEGNVTLNTKYKEFPEDREIHYNVYRKKMYINGVFDLEGNMHIPIKMK